MDQEQQELLLEFVGEAKEFLDQAEPMLIGLPQMTDLEERKEAVDTIFRLFHTLKGGAGFLNLNHLKHLTHIAENLLQIYRKTPSALQEHHVDTLNLSSDLSRDMLDHIEDTLNDEGFEERLEEITKDLEQCTEEASASSSDTPSESDSTPSHLETPTPPPPSSQSAPSESEPFIWSKRLSIVCDNASRGVIFMKPALPFSV